MGELVCPRCGCNKLWKRGFIVQGEVKFQRYECSRCRFITLKPFTPELMRSLENKVRQKIDELKVKER